MKVGFIGVGWMGYGIAKNILKKNHELFVIANKNRKPIDRIVKEGAKEVKSYDELCKSGLDALFLCVTNSPIAHEIGKKIVSLLTDKTIVIDITTHNQNGSIEMEQILNANNIPYLECPVMGLSLIHISEPTRLCRIAYAVFCLNRSSHYGTL